jgi:hypothetical protein
MLEVTTKRKPIYSRTAVLLVALVAALGWWAPPASADQSDKKTVFTFSAPVEIPGKVLPAGTYVFKLLDSTSNRDIVQVWDKDEQHLIATMLALPDYRMTPPDRPIVKFDERASNEPEAIKAWFYPGEQYGWQFVYPNERATQIAKRTKQNVPSMRNDMTEHITAPARSASAPGVQAMKNVEVTGVDPSGNPVEITIILAKTDK